jgi:hypothetical protein
MKNSREALYTLSHTVQSSQAVEGADTVDTCTHSILAYFEITVASDAERSLQALKSKKR